MSSAEQESLINSQYKSLDGEKHTAIRFQQADLNCLTLPNFLTPRFAQNCAKFLNNEATFTDVFGINKKGNNLVDLTEWNRTSDSERFFYYQMLDGQRSDKLTANALNFFKLRRFLSSAFFRKWAMSITELDFATTSSVRVHRMQQRHFLKSHSDRTDSRKVAFILYLTPDWRPEFGGELCIYKDDRSVNIVPSFNTLVLFDVNKHDHHLIADIVDNHCPRISINGWFI